MEDRSRPIQCSECELPVARIIGNCLVIESRHHGDKHKKIITFAELREWMREAEEEDKVA